jgi:hypothetical protein
MDVEATICTWMCICRSVLLPFSPDSESATNWWIHSCFFLFQCCFIPFHQPRSGASIHLELLQPCFRGIIFFFWILRWSTDLQLNTIQYCQCYREMKSIWLITWVFSILLFLLIFFTIG